MNFYGPILGHGVVSLGYLTPGYAITQLAPEPEPNAVTHNGEVVTHNGETVTHEDI